MIQDVKALPVSFYFNPDVAASFFIQKYRGEYVGGWLKWDALFNDLDESPSGHFLRSIIYVKGDFNGYRKRLYSNAELTTRTEWNQTAITARTDKMHKKVKSVLSLRSS